jgi:hypothetical protein
MSVRDEVTFTEYLRACRRLEECAGALSDADPDEAAEHWLPELTRHVQVIFAFVGVNMTARHVGHYARTVAALEEAKVGPVTIAEPSGRLPATATATTTEEARDGGIAELDGGGAAGAGGTPERSSGPEPGAGRADERPGVAGAEPAGPGAAAADAEPR